MAWVSSIRFYLEHPYDLQERILRVERGWKGAPWVQSSKNLANEIDSLYRNKIASRELWMDISLSYLLDHGGLTGIVRTELVLAQELHRLCPSIRFFACDRGRFFEISKVYLEWLFESENLTADLAAFNQRMNDYVSRGGSRSPIRHPSPVSPNAVTKTSPESIPVIDRALLHKGLHQIASVFPQKYVRKLLDRTDYLKEAETAIETSTEQKAENEGSTQSEAQSDATELFFPDNSIIFTAGLDGEMTTTKALKRLRNRDSLYLVQIMYDFTPIITPHLHVDFVPSMYRRYFSTMSKEVNLFLYGGENAKRDGMEFQKKNMLPITKGVAIKFGGNIAKNNDSLPEGLRVLRDLGIHGKFLLSVGTLENRKNHDTLYKAYLELLKRGIDVPQMVFIGGPGWHTKDFMNRITRDDRVKGKILIMRATDTQLNTLYHHCEFTLLASLYEGWSLTLPESFEAGKFCLCSDVAPLREVGRDLIDYVHPWDAIGWADKIQYYLENPQKLRAKETKIESEWQTYTWSSCAKNILDIIQRESGAVLELNE
jgi:glycosyltransferase involved in cell wall biosynthesis